MLLAAAREAASAQEYPAAALYVVATPIGNLADLTLRAVHVLSIVDVVACEDTRVSAGLLHHIGLVKPMLALHEHNEREATQDVVVRLARGERVAYVSDAGTPAISDPGAALVAAVRAAGYRCVPVPGVSAALAALSVAGDAMRGPVSIVGFVAPKGAAREAALSETANTPAAQVLFEAPHRVESLARTLAHACPARPLTLCRELTKQYESVVTLPAGELPAWLAADANRRRGEFVVVLHALGAAPADPLAAAVRVLQVLQRELPLRQAVALTAQITGASRKALYGKALADRDAASA